MELSCFSLIANPSLNLAIHVDLVVNIRVPLPLLIILCPLSEQATQTIQGIILDMDLLMENDIVSSSFSAIDFKKHKSKNFINYPNPQRGQFKEKRFGFFPWHLSDAKEVKNELVLEIDVFKKMQKLRLLQFHHVDLQGSFDVFPKRLRWLRWSEMQLECMPVDFPLESLVVIELQHSRLRKIWHGVKVC